MDYIITFDHGQNYDTAIVATNIQNILDHVYSINNLYPMTGLFFKNRKTVVFPQTLSAKALLAFQQHTNKKAFVTNLLKKDLKNRTEKLPMTMIEQEWKNIETSFFELLATFNIPYKTVIIQIILSSYGSYVSYAKNDIQDDAINLTLYIRNDMGAYEIAEGILSSLYNEIFTKEHLSDQEKDSVIHFLLKYSNIYKLLSQSTNIDFTDQIEVNGKFASYSQHSQQFLASIGYKYTREIVLSCDKILINGQIPTVSFTPTQVKILQLLIEKKQQLCSYEDIGNVIWQNTSQYSLWAISRMIFKIRKKLEQNGIPAMLLKTKKGQGFILEI